MPLASYQARMLEVMTRGKLATFDERATGETTITDPELESVSDRETLDGTLLTRRQAEALLGLGFEPNLTSDPTAFCQLTRCPECGGPLRADWMGLGWSVYCHECVDIGAEDSHTIAGSGRDLFEALENYCDVCELDDMTPPRLGG